MSKTQHGGITAKRGLDFSSPPLYNLLRKVIGNEVPIALSKLKCIQRIASELVEGRDAISFCLYDRLCKTEPRILKAKV